VIKWLAFFCLSGLGVVAAVFVIVLLIAHVVVRFEDRSAARRLRTPLSEDTVTRRLQRELEDW
jgi:hypothetical protein